MKALILVFSPIYQKRLFFGDSTPPIIPMMATHVATIAKFVMVLYKKVKVFSAQGYTRLQAVPAAR
ncbi:hypothetical protein GCM10023188_01240 [Pontibacter saemangeumensis]|uniref:Uncharacterized protein n=1 Tax=Pontibacter saemangeumensis TaxID=1084525 RepID=A0ABP8L751_9BACT